MKKHKRGLNPKYYRSLYNVNYTYGDIKKKYTKLLGYKYFNEVFENMLYEEQVGWYQFLYGLTYESAEKLMSKKHPEIKKEPKVIVKRPYVRKFLIN